MDNQFTFEFNNYLRVSQPKITRVIMTILIGFGLLLVGEYSFFSNTENMQIVGCSFLSNNTITSSNSLDICLYDGFKLSTCINEQFNTGSNYSLSFSVPILGLKNDFASKISIGLIIIVFIMLQVTYQSMHYFNWIKRKRIQQILSEGQIFLNGNKKYEKWLTIYFLCFGICYALLKCVWIVIRNSQYNNLSCDDTLYNLNFLGTLSGSIGTLISSSIGYLLFPLIFLSGWINYLSDLDFKKMTDHLSHKSMKQIKNITILDFLKYNQIIDSSILKKYPNNSKINLFLRKNTFSFFTTPTSEIVDILLTHKISNPQDFEPMLYNESKLSKTIFGSNEKGNNSKLSIIDNDDDNVKLINKE
ncbi:hypothetical protein ACTA71_005138 [Dictyostelium dimigraforme]